MDTANRQQVPDTRVDDKDARRPLGRRAVLTARDFLATLRSSPEDGPCANADPRALSEAVDRAEQVSELVAALGSDRQLTVASMLYPLSERGLLGDAYIETQYGSDVLALVHELNRLARISLPRGWTSGDSLGANQAESLRKMLVAIVGDVRLVLVRLADQLYRLRRAKDASPEERYHVALEAREIYAPLANRLGIWQLKWEMDDLAFRFMEPDTYRRIASWLDERRVDRETYIKSVIHTLRVALSHEGIAADIAGRPKHIYSIWNKMRRKNVDFEHVFDVRAVRLLVESKAECYAALGIVHGMWPYLPGEFDDYIANPKENNYRSLHTAVVGPHDKTVEIQIRTYEMHRHAELGVAAHWQYKEGARDDEAFRQKINWLRRLLEPGEDGETERDFVDKVASEIREDRLYVMTPRGEVVDLPHGGTPLDFAYHVHTDLGHRCHGARVNGRYVPLNYKLASGDQVDIVASRSTGPSRDWLIPQLGYLASNRARSKVRLWFRRDRQERNIEQGQLMLERELGRLGTHPHVNDLSRELNMPTPTELYASVGAGDTTLSDVAQAVQTLTTPAPQMTELRPSRRARQQRGIAGANAIEIEGVGDLLTSYAQCCKPVPPDTIIGYVTQGRGVTIHREDCANMPHLQDSAPERMIPVNWREGQSDTFPVDIRLEAHDRRGLLNDLSGVLSAENVNIVSTETRTDPKTLSAMFKITVQITGLSELSRIMHKLNSVPSVHTVTRTG